MKTLIILLALVGFISTGHAQKITQLKEAKVSFVPNSVKISSNLDNYVFTVKENFTGEFTKNPLAFIKENFDINNLISSIDTDVYEEFLVTFKSSKGYVEANYNKDGKLLKTSQSFKDIVLPLTVRRELYKKHTGWTMVQNKYIASGKSDRIDKEIYKIKLVNGNEKMNVKIDPSNLGDRGVASN